MSTDSPNPYEPSHTDPVPKPEIAQVPELELASRLTRLGARMVDGFIGIIVTVPLMFATGYMDRAMQQQVNVLEVVLWTAGGFGIYIVIHGYLLATRGQTVGKFLVGVKIVDYDTGHLLNVVKLIGLRDLPIGLISAVPCIGPVIALVNILFIFGEEQRCLHDLIAGTRVVNAK